MSRAARIVVPGWSHHITHRGNNRQDIFFTDDDRRVYLEILKRKGDRYGLSVEAYGLMTNHVHHAVIPWKKSSLASAFGSAHREYAEYINDLHGRTGHLWENRYFSCVMDEDHYVVGLCYIETNPQRAGLVKLPWLYPWSSAAAHCTGHDPTGLLDLRRWSLNWDPARWREILVGPFASDAIESVRTNTYQGRPLATDDAVAKLEARLNRRLRPRPTGRPSKFK
jgi:putative transposase